MRRRIQAYKPRNDEGRVYVGDTVYIRDRDGQGYTGYDLTEDKPMACNVAFLCELEKNEVDHSER